MKGSLKRIAAVTSKEVKEIVRVRLFLILAFVVPFIMFNVFGYGISLDIENMPIRVKCNECGKESTVTPNKLLCRHCGDWRTNLISGNELMLLRVELEKATDQDASGLTGTATVAQAVNPRIY